MDLSQVSDQEVLVRLEKLARTERKITHLILWHINEVQSRRLYANLGYSSIHRYLVDHLGYADDSAYRRAQAARVLKQVPQIAEKLEDGSLNLTQLTQVQKCLREEKKSGQIIAPAETRQLLEKLENKNSFETHKVLAQEFDHPVKMHEVLRPQKDESIRLEITLTAEQFKSIQQAKDLLSHALPEGDWAGLFAHLAEKQIKKVMGKPATEEDKALTHDFMVARKVRRKNIPVTAKRRLLLKADNCCEYQDQKTKVRCQSKYQLQIDHRVPLALGGKDEESNFRILCRTHNISEAKRWGLSNIRN